MSKKKYIQRIVIALGLLAVCATTSEAAFTLWSDTPPDSIRADRNNDPVEEQMRRETLARVPELRQKPSLALKPEIPEPLETPRLIGMRAQPADNDSPVLATGTPPRAILPVAAPAK